MEAKKAVLEEAIRKFKDSKQKTSDYMKLFVIVRRVLQPADGLLWSTVEETFERSDKKMTRVGGVRSSSLGSYPRNHGFESHTRYHF